jgi:hypothetical protein
MKRIPRKIFCQKRQESYYVRTYGRGSEAAASSPCGDPRELNHHAEEGSHHSLPRLRTAIDVPPRIGIGEVVHRIVVMCVHMKARTLSHPNGRCNFISGLPCKIELRHPQDDLRLAPRVGQAVRQGPGDLPPMPRRSPSEPVCRSPPVRATDRWQSDRNGNPQTMEASCGTQPHPGSPSPRDEHPDKSVKASAPLALGGDSSDSTFAESEPRRGQK